MHHEWRQTGQKATAFVWLPKRKRSLQRFEGPHDPSVELQRHLLEADPLPSERYQRRTAGNLLTAKVLAAKIFNSSDDHRYEIEWRLSEIRTARRARYGWTRTVERIRAHGCGGPRSESYADQMVYAIGSAGREHLSGAGRGQAEQHDKHGRSVGGRMGAERALAREGCSGPSNIIRWQGDSLPFKHVQYQGKPAALTARRWVRTFQTQPRHTTASRLRH